MSGFQKLFLTFTVAGASTAALAIDDLIAHLALGIPNEKVKKSLTLNSFSTVSSPGNESAWRAHLSQLNNPTDYSVGYANVSVTHNGFKLSQQDLKGRYDLS